jgi:regulator of protease activity HflC (stomatin/prohibitin superfamily)
MHPIAVFIILILLVVLGLYVIVQRTTVYEYEKALRYQRGRFVGLLEAGQYWTLRPFTKIEKIDTRPAYVTVMGQELISRDGVGLKVSLAAQYSITDPDTAVNRVANHGEAMYLEMQIAMRDIVGGATLDELLEQRGGFGSQLKEVCAARIHEFGLTLHRIDVKDIMLPGPIKQHYAQVAAARQEGLAKLERARGETAALRNLTNAAGLLQENPRLMQLRLLEVLETSTGNTFVLGTPEGMLPLDHGVSSRSPAD